MRTSNDGSKDACAGSVMKTASLKIRMLAISVMILGAGSIDATHAQETELVDKIDDPLLNYFALGLLIVVVVMIFYGIIAIHDMPAKIAKERHHPHEDAIHAAGWLSLFTLHVLWPFLWIWA